MALHRWGYDDDTVIAGYQFSAGQASPHTLGTEARVAIRLADWVAYLYRDSFDLARWDDLRSELEGTEVFARLIPTWRLCLPEHLT